MHERKPSADRNLQDMLSRLDVCEFKSTISCS